MKRRSRPRLVHVCLAIAVLAASESPARADGIVHTKPRDGAWVRFDMAVQLLNLNGNRQDVQFGSLTVRSVGRALVKGDICRWIEVDFVEAGSDAHDVCKFLVPEKHLTDGSDPLDAALRLWEKPANGVASEKRDDLKLHHTALDPYFYGELRDRAELGDETIDSKVGKLRCSGVTGGRDVPFANNHDGVSRYRFDVRHSPDVPFGVVQYRCDTTHFRGETRVGRGYTWILKVAEFGDNAESMIPEPE